MRTRHVHADRNRADNATRRPTDSRAAHAHRGPRTVAVAVLLLALTGACTSDEDPGPTAETRPTPSPTSTPTPTPTPTAAATPTPTPTPTPTAPAEEDPAESTLFPLQPGGRVGDFPERAAELDVVAELTAVFGEPPELLSDEHACPTTNDPGRMLRWGNLTVLVRTTDDSGESVSPYVAGWWLMQKDPDHPSADLTTPEGLGLGDPQSRITELYPAAEGGQFIDPATWSWATAPDGDGFHVVTRDEGAGLVVTTISSGYGCGE